jgi:hypothetical protein
MGKVGSLRVVCNKVQFKTNKNKGMIDKVLE